MGRIKNGISRSHNTGSRRAILHIGLPKTGTTSIQNSLFSKRTELQHYTGKVLYPSLASNHSLYLSMMFNKNIPNLLYLKEPGIADADTAPSVRQGYFESIESELRGGDWRTLALSGESMCDFDTGSITRLLEWLKKYVDEVTVIVYVRHPVTWSKSMIQQSLTSGSTFDNVYRNIPRPRWQQRLRPWVDTVGIEKIRLVSFDDACRDDLMGSFYDAAGLPRDELLSLAPSIRTNESMSLEASMLLESLNRQKPLFKEGTSSPERVWRGIGKLKKIPGNRFYMSRENAERARAESREDLKWLNETFGVNLYPDVFLDTPLEETSPPETMPQETADAVVALLSDIGDRLTRFQNKERNRKNRQGKGKAKQ